ncbi:protein kinase [Myxococcus sp. MISCRS1]|uniref:protein kinase domain-containing protein n=1 Tax=Myxococcus sp. MISCRS1 TaxID=2996786 RepID=UPI002270F881|nr:protein kinase [Myxococcus sp. MISCRS1]MCY0996234.1 protein kinase [Myxococcus sp. MISCRS1]
MEMTVLARNLTGVQLKGGWTVKTLLPLPLGATGGSFSVGYLVDNTDGRKGFLKALDYSRALTVPDVARALQALTTAYNFERDVLDVCKSMRMDKIVTAIDYGSYRDPSPAAIIPVDYIIFALADGDIRKHLLSVGTIEMAWRLNTLHHVAVGLSQLHKVKIAHQDLKPSNVLTFGRKEARIADLGRVVRAGVPMPHDKLPFAGDPGYQPIECHYGHSPAEWEPRRLGCDLYHLGNLTAFLFGLTNITAAIIVKLNVSHRPGRWSGLYKDVVPFLRHAFEEVLVDFEAGVAATGYAHAAEIARFVREQCEPDPRERGVPRLRGGKAQYSLEIYISRLNYLAHRAETMGLR